VAQALAAACHSSGSDKYYPLVLVCDSSSERGAQELWEWCAEMGSPEGKSVGAHFFLPGLCGQLKLEGDGKFADFELRAIPSVHTVDKRELKEKFGLW
jgi:hypothetical protein